MRQKARYFLSALTGIVFLVSASTKLLDVTVFARKVSDYSFYLSIEFGNETFRLCVALGVISIEIFLALLMFRRKLQLAGCIGALGMLLFFTAVTILAYSDPYTPIKSCGCFGEVFQFTPFQTLVKNFVLIALTVILLVFTLPASKSAGECLEIVKADIGQDRKYIIISAIVSVGLPAAIFIIQRAVN